MSLSHIRAEDIITGDRTAICNLLEIFQGLMEYLLQRMDSEAEDTGAEGERRFGLVCNLPIADRHSDNNFLFHFLNFF